MHASLPLNSELFFVCSCKLPQSQTLLLCESAVSLHRDTRIAHFVRPTMAGIAEIFSQGTTGSSKWTTENGNESRYLHDRDHVRCTTAVFISIRNPQKKKNPEIALFGKGARQDPGNSYC